MSLHIMKKMILKVIHNNSSVHLCSVYSLQRGKLCVPKFFYLSSTEDYPCGDTVSNDCEKEYENAKNNDDMDSFYGRCFEETGSDRFRERCSLCCENKMDDDDESEGK